MRPISREIALVGLLAVSVLATPAWATPAWAAPAAAQATIPTLPTQIAYVRNGDIYLTRGATEVRLTTDGGHARPRWSPDGRQIAFLTGARLWVMRSDGTGRRQLSNRPAAGPSWSPDGRWIAYAGLSCTGGPGVYRISTVTSPAVPQVLFPTECRTEPLPVDQSAPPRPTGSLADRLRTDDAVAWSPDGSRVAFRGGACESVYDSCLSVGTVTTGAERTIAAYGGGSLQTRGFAVLPSWRPDGARLTFTAYQKGETTADDQPVHVVELNPATGAKRSLGRAQDREFVYLDAARGVLTGQYRGGAWIMLIGVADGSRRLLHAGSQPSVQPIR